MNEVMIFVSWTADKQNVSIKEIEEATISVLEFAPDLKFKRIEINRSEANEELGLPVMFDIKLLVNCLRDNIIARQLFEDAYGETSQHPSHLVNVLNLRTRSSISAIILPRV